MSMVLKHFGVKTFELLGKNGEFRELVSQVEADNNTKFTGYTVKGSYLRLFNDKEYIEIFFYSNGVTEAMVHGTNYPIEAEEDSREDWRFKILARLKHKADKAGLNMLTIYCLVATMTDAKLEEWAEEFLSKDFNDPLTEK